MASTAACAGLHPAWVSTRARAVISRAARASTALLGSIAASYAKKKGGIADIIVTWSPLFTLMPIRQKTVKFRSGDDRFLFIITESNGNPPITVYSTIRQDPEALEALSPGNIYLEFNPTNPEQFFKGACRMLMKNWRLKRSAVSILGSTPP